MEGNERLERGMGARLASVAALVCLLIALTSCASGESSAAESDASGETAIAAEATEVLGASTIDESLYDLECSDRDASGEYDEKVVNVALTDGAAQIDGEGASFANGTLTITEEGTYVLSGTLSDGQVVVEAADDAKVQLVLDGASIANADGPAITVLSGDKCIITLTEGSENSLSDGTDYAIDDEDEGFGAAVYSKVDLTLDGTGSLEVNGSLKHAVFSQDDLVIAGGTYVLKAVGDGLHGHDSVLIVDGDITIEAGDDGIVSNDEDEDHGYVSIDGGTLDITAGDDGIQAFNYLRVTDGDAKVRSGDDALHSDGCEKIAGGTVKVDAEDDAFHAEYILQVDSGTLEIASSTEGLEGQQIIVNDGEVDIVASDDAINASSAGSTGSTMQEGGQMGAAPQGDSGFDGQTDATAQGNGNLSPDESETPPMPDEGEMQGRGNHGQPPKMGDDGATGSTQQGGMPGGGQQGGMPSGGMMGDGADEECLVQINGGTITIDSGGDSVDGNGYVEFNGGTVLASGPTNAGNGALDAALGAKMNGGTVFLVGSAGMAEGFSEAQQGYAQANITGTAGQTVAIVDASGTELASFTPTKDFGNVLASTTGMSTDQEYSIVVR